MEKKLIAAAAAASTLGGAAAGAAFLAPGLAGAQDDTPAPVEETDRPDPGARIAEALQPLVDDGTLTDAQVEAVIGALQDARGEFEGPHGPRGHRGFGGGADIAEVLGLERSELRDALADGDTIADVAAEQGVPVQDVIDAIVDAAEERVTRALESGRIDDARAEEILENAAEKAEDLVNGELEFEGPRGPHPFRGGPGGFGEGEAPADTDA